MVPSFQTLRQVRMCYDLDVRISGNCCTLYPWVSMLKLTTVLQSSHCVKTLELSNYTPATSSNVAEVLET
jgi:hypothetical protein